MMDAGNRLLLHRKAGEKAGEDVRRFYGFILTFLRRATSNEAIGDTFYSRTQTGRVIK